VWGVRELERPFHLTVDHGRQRVGTVDLVVHRRLAFDPASAQCVERQGLRVTQLARSLVDSWPLLPTEQRRPLVLDVARRRLVTADHLRDALAQRPNIAGRRDLAQTVELIADGVQSELEAHGVLAVFRSLPRSIGQFRVDLPGGHVYLDRCWPEVKLVVELDSAAHHTSPEDRRRDLARDRALAALGRVVLRFTYADVVRDPAAVRAAVLAAYRERRLQLRAR
jgi:very-short-patch-repair endonuclease